ncbi:S8 family serine peptidase [Pseudokineococcus sp. 1T1Z-3]|uniref:S8 family serine peptidase n=1 Tax=Pseudokineococcus sp. 1T1Z-3 TaxID=3132745 RepID=UPI0030A797A6
MHPTPSPGTRARRAAAALTGLGLLAATVGAIAPAGATTTSPVTAVAPEAFEDGRYVVTLLQEPAATYEGGVAGLEATAPAEGEKLDAGSPQVQAYQEYLEGEQAEVAAVADAEPASSYTAAINGFAAELTGEQAATLAAQREVLSVERDLPMQLNTIDSPEFLGLTGEDGVWEEVGGVDAAGEGVVVGVLDTGIWPENPSFAGEPVTSTQPGDIGSTFLTGDGIGVVKADGEVFEGECEEGEDFSADLCNDKLVSAKAFSEGFQANVPPTSFSPTTTFSPRDDDGHGSHTAGTAVGNDGVDMTVDGIDFGTGSGMAPAAKLAVYKVCFSNVDPTVGGCYTSDSVAAINQAVLDGVDVLNFSISGSTTTSLSPVEIAFLGAASAGVFVAASAGNSGPTPSTVAHNSPWLTTVAASTHHYFYGTVETGTGDLYRGISITAPLPEQTTAVLSTDVGLPDADPQEVRLCYPGTLDPALVAGTVVVCDRGAIARVDKSLAVAQADGVGMVLANVAPNSLDADTHSVPTVHVDEVAGAAIKEYVGSADEPTIALLAGDQTGEEPDPAPVIAGFSSRGPALAHSGDLLKPDISGPGVSVLAAVAPTSNGGRDFAFYSGTSMSSPHIAGLGALIMGEYPDWSPMAVKSAMMTTAYDLFDEDGGRDTDRFNAGAGHVDPTRFLDPGLVYDSDVDDWLAFLEVSEQAEIPDDVEPLGDTSDFNGPSIAIGALAGRQSVTRTVTATQPGFYRVQTDMPGFNVRVTPRVLYFSEAGQSADFTVRVQRTNAPLDEYGQGSLTWVGSGVAARSPIVAQPVNVAAQTEVRADVADGEVTFDVTPGTASPVDITVNGFVPATTESGEVTSGSPVVPGVTNPSTDIYEVEVPEGTSVVRFDLLAGQGADDLDMYVTDAALTYFAGVSATGDASEQVTLRDPEPGTYLVHVHAFSTASTGGAYELDEYLVAGPEGNASATPDPLVNRPSFPRPLTVSWDGLEEGTRYLGVVEYQGSSIQTVVTLS